MSHPFIEFISNQQKPPVKRRSLIILSKHPDFSEVCARILKRMEALEATMELLNKQYRDAKEGIEIENESDFNTLSDMLIEQKFVTKLDKGVEAVEFDFDEDYLGVISKIDDNEPQKKSFASRFS
jgi:hypothetical protein